MKALLLEEYRKLTITDMPQPKVGDHDVLVQIKACGICGSDIHGFDGSSGRRVPPLIMGHEAAGVVTDTGSAVTQVKEGDRVTFDSMVSCGNCYFCGRNEMNLCENRRVLGVSCEDYRQHGCFAEYAVVPEHIIYPMPDNLPFEHAAMIEPVSVAVHAVKRTPISKGDTAAVIGAGMIGLLVVQALKAAGCSKVIAVDLADEKLKLAQELGADSGINPEATDAVKSIQEATDGRGADITMEVVGATATVKSAVESTRKGGHVTLVGNLAPEVDFPLQSVVTREITIYGSCASNGEYPECIDLLARGIIKVDSLISAKVPLEEGADWFDRLYAAEAGLMKVILQPSS
ncbi:MAG: galactitol-1-phosphate 5-dehydrogenase [Verrucomicrobiota bacterium]|jgi:L-iditol 2-dehydrogenase|nr:galactitol-1-phosphate 5-dehydrogenase [Verrucomicrobiota bacterium]MEE2714551.1 galactitol-1-phosphate 5-dehydrogenase [Verrucomicrobiota bacterium]MEE2813795.1 galactitol-1-phosphate 5-dehydrogenase [Verrucomicrobiota bacterium]